MIIINLMKILPQPIQNLIDELSKLPGIGTKSAQRLAFYLLRCPDQDINNLAQTIGNLKKKIKFCEQCFNLSEQNLCPICRDPERDKSMICVVEDPLDIVALEKTGEYKGIYHVLHGVISPVDGLGPEQLKIKELISRIKQNKDKMKEIILATNPSLEGEATAMYLLRQLKPLGIKVTRIARGLPVGGDLEYADEITLTNALKGRTEI